MIPRLADSASAAPCNANYEPFVGEGMISSESRMRGIRTSGSKNGAPPRSGTAAGTMEHGMLAHPAYPPGSRTAVGTMERAS